VRGVGVTDGIQTRALDAGEPLHDLVMVMMETMRATTASLVMSVDDPRDGLSALMTAANMFAGSQFGALLVVGAVTQQDTKRAADAASRNFREGVKVGLRHATRVARQTSEGTA